MSNLAKAVRRFERLLQCDPTAVEGLLGAISFQMGIWLALPRGAALIGMYTPAISHTVWGVTLMLIGGARLGALIADYRPARQIAAFASCVTWVALALLLDQLAHIPSNPVFYSFAIASAWVLLRLRVEA